MGGGGLRLGLAELHVGVRHVSLAAGQHHDGDRNGDHEQRGDRAPPTAAIGLPRWRNAMPDRLGHRIAGPSGRLRAWPSTSSPRCATFPAAPRCSPRSAAARTSGSSAAPCATRCSGATPKDIDLVVAGDAVALAGELGATSARSTTGSARPPWRWTGRSSTSPGRAARPTPRRARCPTSSRARWRTTCGGRDFAVNAIAVDLSGRPARGRRRARRPRGRAPAGAASRVVRATTRRGSGGWRATRRGWASRSRRRPSGWPARPSPAAPWRPSRGRGSATSWRWRSTSPIRPPRWPRRTSSVCCRRGSRRAAGSRPGPSNCCPRTAIPACWPWPRLRGAADPERLRTWLDDLAIAARERDRLIAAATGAQALAERLDQAARPSEIAAAAGA